MDTTTASKQQLTVPSDLDACQALIRELIELVERLGMDNDLLKQRLHNVLRMKYGRSSEKLSPGQLQLFARELEAALKGDAATPDQPVAASQGEPAKRARVTNGGGGRKPLPASLKRVPKDYFPSEEEMICSCCKLEKVEIGVEILEQLDYVPGSFKVIQHITHKFGCKPCQEGVVEGERPAQIHNGGKATEGVIAQISTSKYADHAPLARQEAIYAREGVDLPRSSMGRWLDLSAEVATPIIERMRELLLLSQVIQADESPIRFLDKDRLPKKCKLGYAWTYYGDDTHPYVIYDIQPDRTAERSKTFLKGYSNLLLTDGYGGYDWYKPELHANCLVHLRRKIEQALKYDKKKAGIVLAMFHELYQIEGRIKGMPDEQILLVRQSESLKILNRMKELFVEWQPVTPPKTSLGIAINYALSRWEKLCRFTQCACLRPDTNLVENAIRAIAIGRKNWQHIGAETALHTASVHMTLVNTCKRLKINPFLYLRDVFIRLGRGDACIDELLPDRWQLQNPLPD